MRSLRSIQRVRCSSFVLSFRLPYRLPETSGHRAGLVEGRAINQIGADAIVTLSLVIVSCCSAQTVRARISIEIVRSTPSQLSARGERLRPAHTLGQFVARKEQQRLRLQSG